MRSSVGRGWKQAKTDRHSEVPAGYTSHRVIAKHERGGWAKSWPRCLRVCLRRAKPKGASSDRGAKHTGGRQGLTEGSNPGTAACCAGPSFRRCDDQQEEQ